MESPIRYMPYQKLAIWALYGGYAPQANINQEAWNIVWSEKTLDNILAALWLYELEKDGIIVTESGEASPELFYEAELRTGKHEDADLLRKWTYDKRTVATIEKKIRKHPTYLSLVGEGGKAGYVEITRYTFKVLNQAKLRMLVDEYLFNFTSGKLKSDNADEPWSWQHQKQFALDLIAEKRNKYDDAITVSNADVVEQDASNRFRIIETFLALEKEGALSLEYLGLDYNFMKRRGEKNPTSQGVVVIRLKPQVGKELKQTAVLSSTLPPMPSTHIKFTPDNYDWKKGRLHIPGIANVDISTSGSAYRPPDPKTNSKTGEMYDQCFVVRSLFKSVNTLNSGIKISQALGVSDKFMTKNHEKQIKNIVSEINRKAKEAAGINRLIIIDGKKIKISKLYL